MISHAIIHRSHKASTERVIRVREDERKVSFAARLRRRGLEGQNVGHRSQNCPTITAVALTHTIGRRRKQTSILADKTISMKIMTGKILGVKGRKNTSRALYLSRSGPRRCRKRGYGSSRAIGLRVHSKLHSQMDANFSRAASCKMRQSKHV